MPGPAPNTKSSVERLLEACKLDGLEFWMRNNLEATSPHLQFEVRLWDGGARFHEVGETLHEAAEKTLTGIKARKK